MRLGRRFVRRVPKKSTDSGRFPRLYVRIGSRGGILLGGWVRPGYIVRYGIHRFSIGRIPSKSKSFLLFVSRWFLVRTETRTKQVEIQNLHRPILRGLQVGFGSNSWAVAVQVGGVVERLPSNWFHSLV